jgi:hypothetical protein
MEEKETLEEGFDRIYESMDFSEFDFASFKLGAKWQQERSYSEEEVEILLETLSKVIVYQGNEYRLPHYFEFEIKELLKQFKNMPHSR